MILEEMRKRDFYFFHDRDAVYKRYVVQLDIDMPRAKAMEKDCLEKFDKLEAEFMFRLGELAQWYNTNVKKDYET